MASAQPQRDQEREQRLARLLAGAGDDEYERIAAWYGYLEQHVRFPFGATRTRRGPVSALGLVEQVEVIGLACVDDWEDEAWVMLGGDKHGLDVPLAQVTPSASTDAESRQAVADWHYWVRMGYHFWTEDQG